MQEPSENSKSTAVSRPRTALLRTLRWLRRGSARMPAGLAIVLIAFAVLPGSAVGPGDLKAAAAVA